MFGSRGLAVGLAAAALIAGCGGGSGTHGGQSRSSGQLSVEAKSAATGDIPDNQVFLTFRNRSGGYAIRYPEGWAQTGRGNDVTFRDKDNVIHISVARGRDPAPASVKSNVVRRERASAGVRVGTASAVPTRAGHAVKVTYTKLGAPSPVTGKRLPLVVDRYVFARAGRVATVDLSTPKGVDNLDAYRMISRSFRWH